MTDHIQLNNDKKSVHFFDFWKKKNPTASSAAGIEILQIDLVCESPESLILALTKRNYDNGQGVEFSFNALQNSHELEILPDGNCLINLRGDYRVFLKDDSFFELVIEIKGLDAVPFTATIYYEEKF